MKVKPLATKLLPLMALAVLSVSSYADSVQPQGNQMPMQGQPMQNPPMQGQMQGQMPDQAPVQPQGPTKIVDQGGSLRFSSPQSTTTPVQTKGAAPKGARNPSATLPPPDSTSMSPSQSVGSSSSMGPSGSAGSLK